MILTLQLVKKLSDIPFEDDEIYDNQTIEEFIDYYRKTFLEFSKQRSQKNMDSNGKMKKIELNI